MKPVLALIALAVPIAGQVKIAPGPEKIAIAIDGRPFTDFHVAGSAVTKPFLHPLRAASGTYVTRMWPMEDVPEEAGTKKDHQHQRGLWFAHEDVNGVDFWNNEASYATPNRGRIVFRSLGPVASGSDRGTLAATFEWIGPAGEPLIREDRVMTFYPGSTLRIIDFDITLTALRAVTFGDRKDGLFGIRLRPALQEDTGTGHIRNADGLVGEKQVWGKPSAWCDYSGEIDGEKLGIAILDHPGNPRPGRWHVRAYGLFAENPFGLAVFTGDATQNGALAVPAGGRLRFRYRVIVHPGDAKSSDIAGQWKRYMEQTGGARRIPQT
jgi:Methane oxygenase PmoA